MADRREILVDAFNVIFAHPSLGPLVRRDAERAREEFLALVAARQPGDARRTWVVFDAHRDPGPRTETGRTGGGSRHGLHVVFARESADTWIQNRIREHSEPAQVTVVTSDRAILETARAHGATILRVAEFLQLPARRRQRLREIRESEKPEHQSAREIEEWRKLFEDRDPED